MEKPQLQIEETYWADPQRRRGLGRLALHSAFSRTMSMVDNHEITHEHAMAHMKLVASVQIPKIYGLEAAE